MQWPPGPARDWGPTPGVRVLHPTCGARPKPRAAGVTAQAGPAASADGVPAAAAFLAGAFLAAAFFGAAFFGGAALAAAGFPLSLASRLARSSLVASPRDASWLEISLRIMSKNCSLFLRLRSTMSSTRP